MRVEYEVVDKLDTGDGYVAIFKWDELSKHTNPPAWANVQKFDRQGNLVWTVHGMDSTQFWRGENDTFVGFRTNRKNAQLVSFGGYFFDLNLDDGSVSYSEMLK